MNCTPTKIAFVPSSTPINHLYDSGYVGSESKSVAKKLFHTLSPIKEDPLRTKKICNDSDSGIFTSPPSIKNLLARIRKIHKNAISHGPPDVVRELNFSGSLDNTNESFSNEETKSEEKDRIITRFPLGSWKCMKLKLIENVRKTPHKGKRQFAENNVDIFRQLKMRNCHFIISNVLSHLSAQDLCHVYGVSKTWQEIVVKDEDATARRKEFLEKKSQLGEENQHKSRLSGANDRYDRSTVLQKFVLGDVTNATPVSKQDSFKQSNTRFDSFIREGKNLKNGSLMKCPKCSFAAKKQNEEEYICTECEHVFCKQSLYPIVKFHDSEQLEVPIIVIGSKKSKRNLKRL